MLAIVDPEFTATPDVSVEIKPSKATGTFVVLLLAVGALVLAAAVGRRSG